MSFPSWLCDDVHLSYYVSSSETTFVGVRRHMFKRFLTSCGIPFPHAYSMFYWAQDLKMLLNWALLSCCAGAAENRLLRGNVIVVKHCQSSMNKFEDMTTEDKALVASVVGRFETYVLCIFHHLMLFNSQCCWGRFARLCR